MFELNRLKAFADAPLLEVRETPTNRLIQRIIQGWKDAMDDIPDTPDQDTDLPDLAERLLKLVRSHYGQTDINCEGPEVTSLFESIRHGMSLHIQACELLVERLEGGDIDACPRILSLVSSGDVYLSRARADLKRYSL